VSTKLLLLSLTGWCNQMKMTEMFLTELTSEVERSKRALEQVPEGKYDWKPHAKSMAFGPLAEMVATIPSWLAMMVTLDELDVAPTTPQRKPEPMRTSAELLKGLEKATAQARAAFEGTTDEFLNTKWKTLAGGKVVNDAPRWEMIRDTFNHLSHHRGQMTVYLRLLGATVPALYGPSADDKRYT
jgi:uncharacterized damage-inducible protein DinB